MTISIPDPIRDRLFRHMGWANQFLLEQLKVIPDGAFALTAENDDWTVGAILMHFVRSAGIYVVRVTGEALPTGFKVPSSQEDLLELARRCKESDARLRELADLPEAMATYVRDGETIHRARSTILGQSVHHATEHRAQIAGVLALHGIRAVDLDAMDVWAYSDAEGLGK